MFTQSFRRQLALHLALVGLVAGFAPPGAAAQDVSSPSIVYKIQSANQRIEMAHHRRRDLRRAAVDDDLAASCRRRRMLPGPDLRYDNLVRKIHQRVIFRRIGLPAAIKDVDAV